MTTKIAFRMKLKPGAEEEYKKRHSEIWPELSDLLIKSGVINYHIFLDRATSNLFAYQEISGNSGSQDLGQDPIVQKWWAYMAEFMDTHPDNSPVSVSLEEVFRLQ